MASATELKVFRSGTLFMVTKGEEGRLVSEARGIGEAASVAGLARHVQVVEPWKQITDFDSLPPIVQEAIKTA